MIRLRLASGFVTLLCVAIQWNTPVNGADSYYQTQVRPVLTKYCTGCHAGNDAESNLRLDTHSNILLGHDGKQVVAPKNAEASLLWKSVAGLSDSPMPPKDSPQPTADEIAVIKKWIELGCDGEDVAIPLRDRLKVKRIPSQHKRPASITALSIGGVSNQLLLGHYDRVEVATEGAGSKDYDVVGKVNQLRLSPDGRMLAVSSGVPGVGGQATIFSTVGENLERVRTIEGHADAIYTSIVSPDGKLVATAGYDRVIHIWNLSDGTLIRKLTGHNGAIYDLDFDATGTVIVSASADETIKVWNVASGERLDTYGQCEAEQYAVRFDSTRNRVIAAGADRRVRVWQLTSMTKPTVSPMLYSVFAHEGAATNIAISDDSKRIATIGEDRQVKLWDAESMEPIGLVGAVDDTPTGILFNKGRTELLISTISGSMTRFAVVSNDAPKSISREDAHTSRDSIQLYSPEETVATTEELAKKRTPQEPQKLSAPCVVSGHISAEDANGESAGDWYAFDAKANQPWVISVEAARSGSPMDSTIDVLDARARPVLRTRLQAIRESYFTFRGKDSTIADDFRLHRWEDMELNELLYAGGEVVKLWLYPRGPDSGFKVYPGFGNRYTYFDTTATTHALNEPAWVVTELAEDAGPIPNGLPVFPIYYSNDDGALRQIGKDSQLTFTPKVDGTYLVRVRDSRGQSGDKYTYKLHISRPNPRFTWKPEQTEVSLRPGVGCEFSILADRFDDCDGDIEYHVEGLPAGIGITSPLVIERGQLRLVGSMFLPEDVVANIPKEFQISFTAKTRFGSREIVDNTAKKLTVKVNDKPAMKLKIVAKNAPVESEHITELVIHPGETISANLAIVRGENKGDIAFGGDDSGRNLPHGCFVDNIGLNGLLIPAGQSVREFFITAAPWVEPQERPFHLKANVDGNPTTLPVIIRVVR